MIIGTTSIFSPSLFFSLILVVTYVNKDHPVRTVNVEILLFLREIIDEIDFMVESERSDYKPYCIDYILGICGIITLWPVDRRVDVNLNIMYVHVCRNKHYV